MLNNKGQSLVLFVILIPIFLLLVALVYDVGKLSLLRDELDNINYIVMDYVLDNMEDENIIDNSKELINKNKKDIDYIEVSIVEDRVYIVIEDTINGIFIDFEDSNIFKVKSSYLGYIDTDNKKIIERDE